MTRRIQKKKSLVKLKKAAAPSTKRMRMKRRAHGGVSKRTRERNVGTEKHWHLPRLLDSYVILFALLNKKTRGESGLMMADANAVGGTSRLQEMDDNLREEKDVLRNALRKVPKEALMSYVLGGDDGMGGAANSTLEPLRFALKQTMRSSSYAFHLTFEALLRQGQDHMAVELFRRWWRHKPALIPD
ncbi:hypothetical protein C4B63_301g9 [Trypanosoma cruzi]|uniref:Uncharacterized protein n=1 Tax=Trypanosoma cruzi TaxID=5693 RepID=A0A2V2UHA9_TRYCR|nr:hypothetical protein C4B63_301g9 [Trypanosoma cruzi]